MRTDAERKRCWKVKMIFGRSLPLHFMAQSKNVVSSNRRCSGHSTAQSSQLDVMTSQYCVSLLQNTLRPPRSLQAIMTVPGYCFRNAKRSVLLRLNFSKYSSWLNGLAVITTVHVISINSIVILLAMVLVTIASTYADCHRSSGVIVK